MSTALARRYVLPLFEVARDAGELDRIAGDLKSLDESLRSSPELRTFLKAPTNDRKVKKSALDEIFKKASPFTLNFLRVVIDKKRTEVLILASRIFDDLLSKERGIVHGLVESAKPIDDHSFKEIEKAVASKFGAKVILEQKIEPSLLGGVRVRVGNQLIDASIQGRLEKLRATLTGE